MNIPYYTGTILFDACKECGKPAPTVFFQEPDKDLLLELVQVSIQEGLVCGCGNALKDQEVILLDFE